MYMLKELSLLKWQEKAAKLAFEDTNLKMVELQQNVSNLEENLKNKRLFWSRYAFSSHAYTQIHN